MHTEISLFLAILQCHPLLLLVCLSYCLVLSWVLSFLLKLQKMFYEGKLWVFFLPWPEHLGVQRQSQAWTSLNKLWSGNRSGMFANGPSVSLQDSYCTNHNSRQILPSLTAGVCKVFAILFLMCPMTKMNCIKIIKPPFLSKGQESLGKTRLFYSWKVILKLFSSHWTMTTSCDKLNLPLSYQIVISLILLLSDLARL